MATEKEFILEKTKNDFLLELKSYTDEEILYSIAFLQEMVRQNVSIGEVSPDIAKMALNDLLYPEAQRRGLSLSEADTYIGEAKVDLAAGKAKFARTQATLAKLQYDQSLAEYFRIRNERIKRNRVIGVAIGVIIISVIIYAIWKYRK